MIDAVGLVTGHVTYDTTVCCLQVRDTYDAGDRLVIVTTDRQSAFDRVLAAVPFKGQVRCTCCLFLSPLLISEADIPPYASTVCKSMMHLKLPPLSSK